MSLAEQPAFPSAYNGDALIRGSPGLTKREFFAAMAMQPLLANAHYVKIGAHISEIMSDAIRSADALIAELERGGCTQIDESK